MKFERGPGSKFCARTLRVLLNWLYPDNVPKSTALPYPNIALDRFGSLIILMICVHYPRFMIFILFGSCSIFIQPSRRVVLCPLININIPRLVESQSEQC